jgi:hypothetical protein
MRNSIEIPTINDIENLLLPLARKVDELSAISNKKTPTKQYYRNKDLKNIYGLSDNTIKGYRDKNIIPYTWIGAIPFYPVAEFNIMLSQNSNLNMTKLDK